MVKKRTSRQKVKDKTNKNASATTTEETASTPAEESSIDAIAGNGYEQLPQNLKRKMLKQMLFYAKLQENQQALSAKRTIAKKSRRRRNKSGQTLKDLSCLAETLPSFREPKSVAASTKLNCKSRQKLVVKETKQLAAVLAHPVFHSDPFSAIQQHLENTLGPQINTEAKSKRVNKGKISKKKKKRPQSTVTVQAMDL